MLNLSPVVYHPQKKEIMSIVARRKISKGLFEMWKIEKTILVFEFWIEWPILANAKIFTI